MQNLFVLFILMCYNDGVRKQKKKRCAYGLFISVRFGGF